MAQFRAKKLDLSCYINVRVIRDHTKRCVENSRLFLYTALAYNLLEKYSSSMRQRGISASHPNPPGLVLGDRLRSCGHWY